MSLSFDSDLSPRFPVPLAARLHAEHRARRASWRRLALPAPALVVPLPEKPAPKPPAQSNAERIEQFRVAHERSLRERGIVHISAIVKVVAAAHGISVENLTGKGRQFRFSRPRMLAMYLAWMAGRSSVQIGKAFRRDHATVVHAHQSLRRQIASSADIGAEIGCLFIACGGKDA